MRAIAIAAVMTIGMSVGGVAAAREWSDPAGRIKFDAPNGWATTQERGQTPGDTFTYVVSGNANNECHFISQPNTGTASATPANVRRSGADSTRFDAATWARTLGGIGSVFPGGTANVQSTSLDSAQFWPIQRAEVQSSRRLVHAAIQLRPGFDLITLCQTYDGADPVDLYNTVIRSVGHPNDAAFQAGAEAEPAPTAAAEQPAQEAEQPRERQRRGRGFTNDNERNNSGQSGM